MTITVHILTMRSINASEVIGTQALDPEFVALSNDSLSWSWGVKVLRTKGIPVPSRQVGGI